MIAVFMIGALVVLVGVGGLATERATAASNLVVNPDFEAGTAGWFAKSGAELVRSAGHGGRWSGRVTNRVDGPRTSVLNDQQNTVVSTTKGATYTASAWVRSTAPGTSVAIRLMEYAGSRLHGQRLASVWLRDTAWREVRVSYTAATDDATIDLNLLAWALPSGASFDADDVAFDSPVATGLLRGPPLHLLNRR